MTKIKGGIYKTWYNWIVLLTINKNKVDNEYYIILVFNHFRQDFFNKMSKYKYTIVFVISFILNLVLIF